MQVVNNEQKYRIYWMYNDSVFAELLKRSGFPHDKIEAMQAVPLKKQIEMWNEWMPLDQARNNGVSPDTTWCFITDGEKVIARSRVTRYHTDRDDRDRARKYSLAKALVTLGLSKAERTKFWVAYLQRTVIEPKVMAPLSAVAKASL